MDWRDVAAVAITGAVVGTVEEVIRRTIKGKAGTLAGGVIATALWPKVHEEIRRWLWAWGPAGSAA